MTKNEKLGVLWIIDYVKKRLDENDVSKKDLEKYSLAELDCFNAAYNAYSDVLNYLHIYFCYGK